MELIHNELVYKIIGFAMEFHKTLGVVFLESVYENAIIFKMRLQHIIFQSQKKYPVNYKGKMIKDFICDLIVENKIVVELKTIKQLGDIERAQIINYLKVTDHQLGLIINFGEKSLNYERIILTN